MRIHQGESIRSEEVVAVQEKGPEARGLPETDVAGMAGTEMVLQENQTTPESLIAAVRKLYAEREEYRARMAQSESADATEMIVKLLCSLVK